MILNDFTAPKSRFSNEQLDAVLAELCGLVIKGQQNNPDFNGMVAAAVLDPKGHLATGVNYLYGNYRVHAERAAIDKYEEEYGELPKGSIVITTLSPCSQDTGDNRYEESCTKLLNSKGVKLAYCGYKDPTQDDKNKFTVIITDNSKIKELCKQFADTFLDKELSEVIHHPGIKTKTQDTSGIVNKGEPVPPGKEQKLLGTLAGKLGAYEVYKWDKGNDSAYSVFDPKTRISQLTVSGHNKPHNFEIFGVYGGPKSPVRAADLYAWLVKNQGLTLVSDKYQSPGGQRVWQELEQRYGRSVNVYAFNMKTNQPINTGADDPESTHGTRGDIAQNVRLVAAPK